MVWFFWFKLSPLAPGSQRDPSAPSSNFERPGASSQLGSACQVPHTPPIVLTKVSTLSSPCRGGAERVEAHHNPPSPNSVHVLMDKVEADFTMAIGVCCSSLDLQTTTSIIGFLLLPYHSSRWCGPGARHSLLHDFSGSYTHRFGHSE